MKRVLMIIFAASIIPLCLAGCSDKKIADEKVSLESSVEKYIVKQEVKKYKKAAKHAAYLKKLKLEQKKHAKKSKKKHITVREKLLNQPLTSIALKDEAIDCEGNLGIEGCLVGESNEEISRNELGVIDDSVSGNEEDNLDSDTEDSAIENESQLTEDFAAYNEAFYKNFSEALMLMNSALDAFSSMTSDDVISNAKVDTANFNELLNNYSQTAKPQNEKDQALFNKTIELIDAQEAVNEQLIQWLESGETSLTEDLSINKSNVSSLLKEGLALQE